MTRIFWMSIVVGASAGLWACSQHDSTSGTAESQNTEAHPICTAAGACPKAFDDLTRLSSANLRELFDKAPMGEDVFDGSYSGLPLCFPQEMPPASAFPAKARAEQGFDQLIGAFHLLSSAQMNRLAGFIWHGKKFTSHETASVSELLEERPGEWVFVADVINNIGRPDVDFSAEASLLLDRKHKSIDLDYSFARTGLLLPNNVPIPGISKISLPIVRHIWDRVRLVNPTTKLYVGQAYVIDEPGVYDEHAVPLCFFALTPKSTGQTDPRPDVSPGSPSDAGEAPPAADAGPNGATEAGTDGGTEGGT